ncbi:MAG: hypothetical protein ACD_52C00311G0001, partial [uncultured bacterium]
MQNLRINRSRSFWPLIASLIILLVYWIVIVPGIRGAQDFPYTFQASLVEGFNLPQTWSTRTMGWIGEYVVGTLWSWPVDFLYGVGGMVGVDFWLLERLLGIFPAILLAAYSINAAFNYYEVKGLGKIAGTLLYLLNSYFILLIDGGQIAIALAYALLPLCFVNFLEAQGGSIKFKLFFGICVSALGFFDIRFVYVLGILIFLKILFDFAVLRKVKIIGNHFKTGTTTIFVFLGLNAYWLLPAFLAKHPALPSAFVQRSQIDFLSFAKLGHALSLLSPHWYKNVFGKVTPLNPWLFVIPLFVFLTPMLVRRKQVFFWTLVAFLSVFLVKGNNPPFEGVYELLFLHLPGFSLFRDPTKFFVLVCLAYSILFGNVLTVIMHRLPRVKTVALFAIAVYFVASTFPVWSNQMTGLLSFSRYEDEYKAVAKIMESDMGYGRILWVPKKYPLGFSSPNHSSVELSAMVQKWPFARGVVGKYEYSNFLREMPHIGQLLDVLGVKYLAFPFPDTKREDIKQDNVDYYYSFLDQISSQAWVQERLALPPVALLKTKESQNRFFVSENTLAVIGSDDIYKDFVKSSNFRLANNAIIFLEETPGLGSRLKDLPDPEVILNSKANIDLAVALNVPKELFFFPATQLPADPDSKSGWPASNVLRSNAGWWKRETNDIIWWRDFLETKYGIDNRDFD